MKKLISLLTVLTLVLSMLSVTAMTALAAGETILGSGTEADPYLIGSKEALAAFAAAPVDGAYYKLTSDIAWSDYDGGTTIPESNWTPIDFNGTFDGDGHTISGLVHFNADTKSVAFFKTATGTIKNLTIDKSAFYGSKNVAAFVALLPFSESADSIPSLTIENCVNRAAVAASKNDEDCYVGAFVGDAFANAKKSKYFKITINACVNHGNILMSNVTGTVYAGGFVGRIYGNPAVISNSANFGNVTTNGAAVGGLVGQSGISKNTYDGYSTVIENCLNTGIISGTRIIGGVVGRAYPGTEIKNCVNTGGVGASANSSKNTGHQNQFGAIVGQGPDTAGADYTDVGTVTNCFNSSEAVLANSTVADAKSWSAALSTAKTLAELNTEATATALGSGWTYNATEGLIPVALSKQNSTGAETTTPETTTPSSPETTAPETNAPTTEPTTSPETGDVSAIILAAVCVTGLAAVMVAKKKER